MKARQYYQHASVMETTPDSPIRGVPGASQSKTIGLAGLTDAAAAAAVF